MDFSNVAIVISNKDSASVNIGNNFERLFGRNYFSSGVHFSLVSRDIKGIYDEELEVSNYDLVFFASTHSSEKKMSSLSIHTPGNFSNASLGGKDKMLCISPAKIMRSGYFSIRDNYALVKSKNPLWKEDYLVTLEVTHHGPYIKNVPVVFIEIGSDESHWSDVYAGEVIARSIVDSVLKLEDYCLNCKSVVGVGGPHYANNFMELMEKSDYCVGHMIPKYALSGFDRDMVHQLIMRTDPKPDLFVLDYKGLGPDKQRVKDALSGFNWKKTSDLKGDVVDKNEC